MRLVLVIMLFVLVSLLTACSYKTDFVIINGSERPVEIHYKVKNYPGAFAPPATPATIASSQLSTHGNQQWNALAPTQYQLDQEGHSVHVQLRPHEAFLVASMHNYGGHKDARDAEHFPIEEITITGAGGEVTLKGRQTLIAFSNASRALYTLTYNK